MNRLNKELKKRGIVFESNDYDYMYRPENDNSAELVSFTNELIIIALHSMVMPTELRIYDKNLNIIGGQEMYKEAVFSQANPFSSWSSIFVPNNTEIPFN